jgi:hypothetical protein
MRGGREEECVPRATILRIQQDPTRLCPRVELQPENEVAAEVAWFAVKLGGDHPLFGQMFTLQTSEMGAEDRLRLFYRVIGAVSDPGIAARIKAERERALRNKD